MASSAYPSTPGTTYNNRISRVLLGPCSDQLRDVLRLHVPPGSFPSIIRQYKSNLPRLTATQRNLILPRTGHYSGDYSDMDISLLYLLLRNLCSAFIPEPVNGWGNSPDMMDFTVSANIERIREARNKISHSSCTFLSQAKFNDIWTDIKRAVKSIDIHLMNRNKYEKEIDFLRTETMDPEQAQFYTEQVRKQVEEETRSLHAVIKIQESISDQDEVLRALDSKIQRTDTEVQSHKREIDKIKHQMQQPYTLPQLKEHFQAEVSHIAELENLDNQGEILNSRCKQRPHAIPGHSENSLCIDDIGRTYSLFATKLLQDAKKEYEGTQMFLCRDSKDKTVIIGYDTTMPISKIEVPDKYTGRLLIKHPKNISDEAFRASKYVLENKRNLDAEEQNIIQRCICKHSSNLWKAHSNLTMISGDCVKYTGGIPNDTVCIVLYCLSKGFIPIKEDIFPTRLQENGNFIEVDVREGYFQFGPNNLIGLTNSWNDPICMGSSIANEKVGKTGSVGPFVNLPNDEIGFLTCCHVLFDCIHSPSLDISYEEPQEGKKCNDPPFVIQPSSSAVCGRDIIEKRCGYVKKAIFKPTSDPVSVDAALVKVTNRIPNTGHFAISEYTEITETGYTKESPPMYTGGKIIRYIQSQDREKPLIKSGTKTGLTKGEFRLNGLEVSIAEDGAFLGDALYYPKRVMKGQYEIRSSMTFFDLGDSGSGVFLKDPDGSLKCIGIAIGRTSFYGTVVTPIGAVLQELGLEEKDMTNFGHPMG